MPSGAGRLLSAAETRRMVCVALTSALTETLGGMSYNDRAATWVKKGEWMMERGAMTELLSGGSAGGDHFARARALGFYLFV